MGCASSAERKEAPRPPKKRKAQYFENSVDAGYNDAPPSAAQRPIRTRLRASASSIEEHSMAAAVEAAPSGAAGRSTLFQSSPVHGGPAAQYVPETFEASRSARQLRAAHRSLHRRLHKSRHPCGDSTQHSQSTDPIPVGEAVKAKDGDSDTGTLGSSHGSGSSPDVGSEGWHSSLRIGWSMSESEREDTARDGKNDGFVAPGSIAEDDAHAFM
jgi:hypothetical protein